MMNEVLAKIVCHNLRCVIHEWYQLGIDPRAFGVKTVAPKDAPIDILKLPG